MAQGLCNKISGFLLCLKYILILLPSQSYRNSKTPTRQNKLHLERIMMVHIFMRWYQTCTCPCQHLGSEIFCKLTTLVKPSENIPGMLISAYCSIVPLCLF